MELDRINQANYLLFTKIHGVRSTLSKRKIDIDWEKIQKYRSII